MQVDTTDMERTDMEWKVRLGRKDGVFAQVEDDQASEPPERQRQCHYDLCSLSSDLFVRIVSPK